MLARHRFQNQQPSLDPGHRNENIKPVVSDLANENIGHPVWFEFKKKKKNVLVYVMPCNICDIHTYAKKVSHCLSEI